MVKLPLKLLRLLPVVLILLAFLAASPASAAENGLRVQGAILQTDVSPGQNLTYKMTVSIGTEDPATEITVRLGGYGQELNGGSELLETADNAGFSARDFITLDKESFHLEPGGSEVVTATIQVPLDVGAGGRYALINIRTGGTGEGGVSMVNAMNVPIVLTVKDTTLTLQGEITELDMEAAGEGIYDISTIFHNTGNYHLKVKAEITISNSHGQKVGNISLPLTSRSIIPNMLLRLPATYNPQGALSEGTYIVKSQVMLEDGTVLDEEMAAFEVTESDVSPVPLPSNDTTPVNWLIIEIIGGVVVIGLLVFFLVRRRARGY